MILTGDCIEQLKTFDADSVDCCVTSPPYYGLRDYGVDGQIGLEDTPEKYIEKMTDVFRDVRRVLKPTGTCWVNIGDSYCNSNRYARAQKKFQRKGRNDAGFKTKDLIGIPWMLAFALRADGWYLRQDIIWHKPNSMPEGVKDRCTKAHEYIFLLTKSARYFYDHTAIMELANYDGRKDTFYKGGEKDMAGGAHERWREDEYGNKVRNKRSVWKINTKPYKGAHFATFPPELPRLCISAGCPKDGIVIDPFAGSGTTLAVAKRLGRKYIGVELNPEYISLIEKRLAETTFQKELFG